MIPFVGPIDSAHARTWLSSAGRPDVANDLEAIYMMLADQVAARGPACWASGRCCNFARSGHDLYVTGLEAAYTVLRSREADPLTHGKIAAAREAGGCPFQTANLCGVHLVRPLACRVYFCDRSAQNWQRDLSERFLGELRALHQRHEIPYRYAEWRTLLEAVLDAA